MRRFPALVLVASLVAAGGFAIYWATRSAGPTRGSVAGPATPESATVDQMGVWELTIPYETGGMSNPQEGVRVEATVVTPGNRSIAAPGFYYDSGTFKVRFVPVEAGQYMYTYSVSGPSGPRSGSGRFSATPTADPGFLMPANADPPGLVVGDGTRFDAVGVNECVSDTNENGELDDFQMDGGLRSPGEERSSEAKVVSADTYFAAYGAKGARFNLLRWNPGNCGFNIVGHITASGNTYPEIEGKLGDQLLQAAKKQGLRVWFTFFTGAPPFPDAPSNARGSAAVKRYIDYAMARYGAYVDMWELTNETVAPGATAPPGPSDAAAPAPSGAAQGDVAPPGHGQEPAHPGGAPDPNPGNASDPNAPPTTHGGDSSFAFAEVSDAWLQMFTDYIRASDPYGRMVTNSFPRPVDSRLFDVLSPHWYQSESELSSDTAVTAQLAAIPRNMPVMFGEQGNSGENWDPSSARRLRIRAWTSWFQRSTLVFWNLTFAKDCKCYGVYLGPEERGFVRALQGFADGIKGTLSPFTPRVAEPDVRAYGVTGAGSVAVYLQHSADHESMTSPSVTVDVPADGVARWIDPATGNVVASTQVGGGTRTLRAPGFTVDLALAISAS